MYKASLICITLALSMTANQAYSFVGCDYAKNDDKKWKSCMEDAMLELSTTVSLSLQRADRAAGVARDAVEIADTANAKSKEAVDIANAADSRSKDAVSIANSAMQGASDATVIAKNAEAIAKDTAGKFGKLEQAVNAGLKDALKRSKAIVQRVHADGNSCSLPEGMHGHNWECRFNWDNHTGNLLTASIASIDGCNGCAEGTINLFKVNNSGFTIHYFKMTAPPAGSSFDATVVGIFSE